jgi:hypothetical protein|tara:strand:- start:1885 stop:2409 length:525 start_codon:yes stop_codon:yes gene_type:complete
MDEAASPYVATTYVYLLFLRLAGSCFYEREHVELGFQRPETREPQAGARDQFFETLFVIMALELARLPCLEELSHAHALLEVSLRMRPSLATQHILPAKCSLRAAVRMHLDEILGSSGVCELHRDIAQIHYELSRHTTCIHPSEQTLALQQLVGAVSCQSSPQQIDQVKRANDL